MIKIGFVHELNVDSELVRTFYAENWKRKIALSNRMFYEWQFIRTPNSNNKDHCVIAFDEQQNKIIGVMGLNKRNFFLGGNVYNGAELTTWIVSEEAIGSGIGAKILIFIQSQFDILIGMGIGEMALPIYMRCGFRYIKNIPRFIKVINFERVKDFSTYSNLALKLIKQWKSEERLNYVVKDVSTIEYSEIFDLQKCRLNIFDRDEIHRIWRYHNHPVFEYQEFLIRSSEKPKASAAYVSWREECSIDEFKILHVMDLFGDDISLGLAVRFIEDYASEKGFDIVDFYCTASSVYKFMLSNGWFSICDDNCFQFPHLFHPVEMRTPPTTSLVYWAKNYSCQMSDISKLYITKEDADLDRPTFHTLALKDRRVK